MSDTIEQEEAHGWLAIEAALQGLYGDVEPLHWGTIHKYALGGPDPLDGISIYRNADHWHYVSYGMTELYGKESDDPAWSGWGFEFTFRLRSDEPEPPFWPASLMQNLARYVYDESAPFAPGATIGSGPIRAEDPTELTALFFEIDPELGAIETPNGAMGFLQIVGITRPELEVVRATDVDERAALYTSRDPLMVTDLRRGSYFG